jgi:hypothetical protein
MPKTSHLDAAAHKRTNTRSITRSASPRAGTAPPTAGVDLLSPDQIIGLQRTAGNAAVQRMLDRQPAISHTSAQTVQRAGNWDNFKNFAGGQWQGFKGDVSTIGNAIDPRPAYASQAGRGGWHNQRRAMGGALMQGGIGGIGGMFAGLGSGLGRGIATLGAGAYYGARGLGGYVGQGAQALGGYAKEGYQSLGNKIGESKRKAWDPLTGHQRANLAGNVGGATVSGVGVVGSSLGNMINSNTAIPQGMSNQADISIAQGGSPLTHVSDVGQGFSAAGGVGQGLGGLINMGSGIGNLFGKKEEGKGYQRFTRGMGRTLVGGAQAFTGAAVAGKAIGTLTGASAGASMLASAVLPAQAALSGIDIIRGSYMLNKARRRKNALRGTQHDFEQQRDQQTIKLGEKGQYEHFNDLAKQAQMAKQYQNQRKRTAGINLAAGILGGLGAGLTLSGVGAIAGIPLMAAAGLLKLGGSLYGKVRDNTYGRKESPEGREKADGSKETIAEVKNRKEIEWATYMAQNYQDPNVKRILKEMGAESIALDDEKLAAMNDEQRMRVMWKQLMKR